MKDTPALDTDVAIETPEHIVFDYRIAGPARRAVGYVLDLLVCYGAFAILAVVVIFAFVGGFSALAKDPMGAGKAAGGILLVVLFAAQWLYFLVWEGLIGRSPGKMAAGIRVVTITGRPIGWRAAGLRNLLRAADLLPFGYFAGVVSMTLSSRFQRLGDLVAGTIVVIPARTSLREAMVLSPPAAPSELGTFPEVVVLDADERAAIELFLRRRHALGPAREQELARMIAPKLAARLDAYHADPARLLALAYDRAVNAGRTEAPPSSLRPSLPPSAPPWR